ncbi:unnamed protein product [Musa textilis]
MNHQNQVELSMLARAKARDSSNTVWRPWMSRSGRRIEGGSPLLRNWEAGRWRRFIALHVVELLAGLSQNLG